MGNTESSDRSPRALRPLKSTGKNKANDEDLIPTNDTPTTSQQSTCLPSSSCITSTPGANQLLSHHVPNAGVSSNSAPVLLFTGPIAHNGLCDNPGCSNRVRLFCETCYTAPVQRLDPPVAQYCSEDCMNQHREAHAPVCDKLQDRTALFRIVELAQNAFYVFREMNWHEIDVRAMEMRDDVIVINGKVSVFVLFCYIYAFIIDPVHIRKREGC